MFVTIIEWLIIIGIFVTLFFYAWDDIDRGKRIRNIQESKEFNDALVSIRKINQFFEDAAKMNDGYVIILSSVLSNDPQYRQLNCPDKYNHLLYFRVKIGTGHEWTLNQLRCGNLSDIEKKSLEDLYLKDTYGKTKDEIADLGISWSNLIYDVEMIDRYYSLLYYKFYCPCELNGAAGYKFVKRFVAVFS